MNNCKYHRTRTKDYKQYRVCLLTDEINPICRGCKKADYKSYKPLIAKTGMKKITPKQRKAERERYSIFTSDLKYCIEDKDHLGEIDKHECFNGKNRLKSMKYGLVVPLCRSCHNNDEVVVKWQVRGRQAFIKEYGEEKFVKEFQTRKGVDKDE